MIRKLIKTISNVGPKVKKIVDKLGEIIEKLSKLAKKLGKGDGGTVPSSAARKADAPNVDAPTTPSSAHTPDGSTTPSSAKGTDSPDTTSPSKADTTSPSSGGPDSSGTPSGSKGDTPPSGSPTKDHPLAKDAKNPQARSQEPIGRCGRREPIDMASGEMFLVQTDVELPGILPVVLQRVHVSSYRSGRAFGPSWASTLDQRLEIGGDKVYYAGPDGVILVYPLPGQDGDEVFAVAGARWPLARSTDGGYVIRQPQAERTLHFRAPRAGVAGISAVADRGGNRIDFEYGENGMLGTVRHSGGYRIDVDSDGGRITELRLGNPSGTDVTLVRYGYDAAGQLSEVINSSGRSLRFTYDTDGRITRWEDRNGQWYGYTYDADGRCVRTDGSGEALAGILEYDVANRLTRETNSMGQVAVYHFNELRQLIRQEDPLGNVTLFAWDPYGMPTTETDPLGRTTRFRYNESGDLIEVVRPDGRRSTASYDPHHLPLVITDPDGGVWRRIYDETGNTVAVVDPSGATTGYGYQDGRLVSVTDPLGAVRRVETDAAGLVLAVVDPLGETTRYTRDAFGRIVTVDDPVRGVTRMTWTVEGKPHSRQRPDGSVEQWRYDGEGNEVEFVDPMGNVTRTLTTHFDLPSVEIGPLGERTEFRYDSELRLVAVTNPQGLVWRYEYDHAGRLIREVDFDGRVSTFRHDAAGQLVERTNGAGQTVRFERNLMGEVVARRYDDGREAIFERDGQGRVLRARNADADVHFQRDAIGRVVAETVNGRTVVSNYDIGGRRTSRRTSSGVESVWSYNTRNQPVSLRVVGRTMTFGYDDAGRETERLLDTGTILAQTWDANSRLTDQTVSTVGGATDADRSRPRVLQRRSYRYRENGVLSEIDDMVSGRRRFASDPAGRIVGVDGPRGIERYAYDAGANVTHASLPGSAGEMEGPRAYEGTLIRNSGRTSYRYDLQGRLVMRRKQRLSAKPDVWHYDWDAEDRLVGVATPGGTRWRYSYDALGRRVAKERLSPDGGSVAERTDFVWDGVQLAEQVVGGTRATTWEYEPGTFRPLLQAERVRMAAAPQQWIDEQFYSIIADLVGAPSELVDATGNLSWHDQRTLWGQSLGGSSRTITPLRFAGQYHDEESGFNYNYQRYYDPEIGRYVSRDPLGLDGGPNPAMYASNPTSWIDPLGLMGCGDDAAGGPPRSREELLADARAQRDQHAADLVANTPKRQRPPSTATAGYDPETGNIAVGSARPPHGCAENDVANKLGIPRDQVQFTEAVRPRTGEEVEICHSCQGTYTPNQFPPGTKVKKDGSWGVDRVGE
ncbi:RHS repeat-associated core domain-containing protein [Amycolatopsis sp.]|uniref:RHS repeat-associated core domain-containing protein n=1 Tax=Amycolatopsis sp. TaxID=37632 RepID=UPI002E0BBB5F|nr:RHS repeat-associated core domain-containing protein [Amycolatopsis sp.]